MNESPDRVARAGVVAAAWIVSGLAACGGAEPVEPAASSDPAAAAAATPAPAGDETRAPQGSAPEQRGVIVESGDSSGSARDPRVSTSAGQEGGAVILWPREMGNMTEPAGMVQQRLRRLVQQAMPGVPIDVRPQPERACPRGGCKGVAVGALFVGMQNGCAVVAFVVPPGDSPMTLVPWAGGVELKRKTIPFRDPVENHVQIRDFASCGELEAALSENESDVLKEIRLAAD